jgi:hypothetical protein
MKNDKQKLLIIGVLGVVLIGVGAFSFMPKGPATGKKAATEPKVTAEKTLTPQEKMRLELEKLVQGPLPPRDPFAVRRLAGNETPPPATNTTPPPTQPQTNQRPPKASSVPRTGIEIPPAFVEGPLPNPNGGPLGPGPRVGGPGLEGSKPLRNANEFAYSVKGVIVGANPMAVFEDDKGHQRLIPLGGSIDGDSRVVGIDRGRVTIKHRGKAKTLTIQEGSH